MINEKIICKNKEQTSLYRIISHKNSSKSLMISMEQAKETETERVVQSRDISPAVPAVVKPEYKQFLH